MSKNQIELDLIYDEIINFNNFDKTENNQKVIIMYKNTEKNKYIIFSKMKLILIIKKKMVANNDLDDLPLLYTLNIIRRGESITNNDCPSINNKEVVYNKESLLYSDLQIVSIESKRIELDIDLVSLSIPDTSINNKKLNYGDLLCIKFTTTMNKDFEIQLLSKLKYLIKDSVSLISSTP